MIALVENPKDEIALGRALIPLRKLAHAINRDYFSAVKIENFQLKIFGVFLLLAQNIDCGYTLEHVLLARRF